MSQNNEFAVESVEYRLRKLTSISENQYGLMRGRFSLEAMHLVRKVIK